MPPTPGTSRTRRSCTPGSDPALDVEGPENQLRWFDFYRAAEGRISTDTPRGMAIWREADAAGVSVHKTDEAARNPRAVQAAIRAVPEVAEAATKALVSTPESADRTYRKARAALISQARDDQGRPPPEKQDRVKRIEDVCEDVIRKLAEVLDPDTDPLGQRLAFLEQNLDALGEPHRKRLGRAVIRARRTGQRLGRPSSGDSPDTPWRTDPPPDTTTRRSVCQ